MGDLHEDMDNRRPYTVDGRQIDGSDLLQRAEASDEVSRRSAQPCRFTMNSTHTGT